MNFFSSLNLFSNKKNSSSHGDANERSKKQEAPFRPGRSPGLSDKTKKAVQPEKITQNQAKKSSQKKTSLSSKQIVSQDAGMPRELRPNEQPKKQKVPLLSHHGPVSSLSDQAKEKVKIKKTVPNRSKAKEDKRAEVKAQARAFTENRIVNAKSEAAEAKAKVAEAKAKAIEAEAKAAELAADMEANRKGLKPDIDLKTAAAQIKAARDALESAKSIAESVQCTARFAKSEADITEAWIEVWRGWARIRSGEVKKVKAELSEAKAILAAVEVDVMEKIEGCQKTMDTLIEVENYFRQKWQEVEQAADRERQESKAKAKEDDRAKVEKKIEETKSEAARAKEKAAEAKAEATGAEAKAAELEAAMEANRKGLKPDIMLKTAVAEAKDAKFALKSAIGIAAVAKSAAMVATAKTAVAEVYAEAGEVEKVKAELAEAKAMVAAVEIDMTEKIEGYQKTIAKLSEVENYFRALLYVGRAIGDMMTEIIEEAMPRARAAAGAVDICLKAAEPTSIRNEVYKFFRSWPNNPVPASKKENQTPSKRF